MSKLLLIDDDEPLTKLVKAELELAGWSVECAHTYGDGWQLLQNFAYDMILLDWQLPDGTGLKLCHDYRDSGGTTPIIFLTGKSDIDSKEIGLDSGADDYITKPFDVREILARIRSVQRRPRQLMQKELSMCGASLDLKLSTITFENQNLRLSPTELSILEFFFRNPDQVFSSAQLFTRVWASDTDAKEDTVRVHMHILRRKLAPLGLKELIKTVRASGYILESNATK